MCKCSVCLRKYTNGLRSCHTSMQDIFLENSAHNRRGASTHKNTHNVIFLSSSSTNLTLLLKHLVLQNEFIISEAVSMQCCYAHSVKSFTHISSQIVAMILDFPVSENA